MKIDSKKYYKVAKITSEHYMDCGILLGEDVKRILKGYTYEVYPWETVGTWFSKTGRIGYDVKEVEA